jgi:hypothetical protein
LQEKWRKALFYTEKDCFVRLYTEIFQTGNKDFVILHIFNHLFDNPLPGIKHASRRVAAWFKKENALGLHFDYIRKKLRGKTRY